MDNSYTSRKRINNGNSCHSIMLNGIGNIFNTILFEYPEKEING